MRVLPKWMSGNMVKVSEKYKKFSICIKSCLVHTGVFSPSTPTKKERAYLQGHCRTMPSYSSIQLLQTAAETFSQWMHPSLKCKVTHPKRPSLRIKACVPVRAPFMSGRNRRVHLKKRHADTEVRADIQNRGCLWSWTEFKLNSLHKRQVGFKTLDAPQSCCFFVRTV